MGVANTVPAPALRSKEPPAYQRESKGSFGDPFEPESPSPAHGDTEDAGHRDRRAHRLDKVAHGLEGASA